MGKKKPKTISKKFIVVADGFKLTLNNLTALVEVSVGQKQTVSVKIVGKKKAIKGIVATKNSNTNVRVDGTNQDKNLTGGYSSGSSINVGHITNSNNISIIGGVVMSGVQGMKVKKVEPIKIIITVPPNTDLEVQNVESTTAVGLAGRLDAYLNNQDELFVNLAHVVKLSCDGQSNALVQKVTGAVLVTCSDQSTARIGGRFNNVSADASDQSDIKLGGNCHDFIATSKGQSDIELTGTPSGRVSKRSYGQSDIDIY